MAGHIAKLTPVLGFEAVMFRRTPPLIMGIGDPIESGADREDGVEPDVHVLEGRQGDHRELGPSVRHR